MEIFQRKMVGKTSTFIKAKKQSSTTKLKSNLVDINKNSIDKGLTDNFYTQNITLYNAVTNVTYDVTLA